ncbi:LacI family DNA-binding transcriptional regulator [Salinibacterium sp. ZJ70]|uniref:LacI family DNA-binding transcriptional regulator n=1 Tax=Salinibacterium sp. ZJ70 TaxID=2708084 RepID=UPI00141FC979|nr:LacI family DNA-binding transcriptional regulator [Salinibacterium sp. ZJ70]
MTHDDIARACGVSRATVSYVLNDVPGRMISDATKELVLRTARELGHVPYAPARMLRLGRSDVVLALVRDFSPGFISNSLLKRLDVALAERGFVLLTHRYDASLRSLQELWQLVSPSLVVVMGGLTLSEQERLDATAQRVLRVHGTLPNAEIGRMQAAYLAERGHRVIGSAVPGERSLALIALERLRGLREECARLGLADPQEVVVDPADVESAAAALDALLAIDGLTAVAAHNDDIAVALIGAMRSRGLVPGEDLAIVGVDNSPTARTEVSTVEIDVDRWADRVIAAAVAILDDVEPPEVGGDDLIRMISRSSA